MSSYTRGYSHFMAHQRPTVGDTKTTILSEDHMGWLKCDGRLVSTKEFYFLFQAIKYSFGGSGGQFALPDAGGMVPGIVGTGTDSNSTDRTFLLGQQVGEYTHRLTIPEIPSHNHGVAAGVQNSANNSTSIVTTGISVNTSTTGVYDSGHTHAYTRTNDSNNSNADATDLTSSSNNEGTNNSTTGSGNANIVDPGHIHPITDPGHAHVLNSAGGDQYHNNIQPTLPLGNLFIYSGKVNYGNFPNIKNIYTFY
jgi:microcystin-dependent protein